MNSGFRKMLDTISAKAEERSFNLPTGQEEPPRICDPNKCKITACPQRGNPDQWGKECWYYTPKTEEIKEKFQAKPNINEQLLRRNVIEEQVEKSVTQILKPIDDRLKRLEGQSKYKSQPHLRGFNGTPIPAGFPRLYRESLRGDTVRNG